MRSAKFYVRHKTSTRFAYSNLKKENLNGRQVYIIRKKKTRNVRRKGIM